MMTQPTHAQDGEGAAISAKEFQGLVEMIGADVPEVVVDLLDTYLEESAGLIAMMQESVQQRNLAAILRSTHNLKSSSASVGAMRLSRLAADLEMFLRGAGVPMNVPGNVPGGVPAQVVAIAQEFELVRAALEEEKAQLL